MKTEKKTYWEKLRDPRWQEKRLKILQRANFTCELCGDKSSTLHVHHGYYEKGLDPWEYEEKTLHCLCETCHEIAQEQLRDIHREIAIIGPRHDSFVIYAISDIQYALNMHKKFEFEDPATAFALVRVCQQLDGEDAEKLMRRILIQWETEKQLKKAGEMSLEGPTPCTLGTSNSTEGSSIPK